MTREEILKNIKSCTCGYDRCNECTLKNATGFTCIDELLASAAKLIENQPEIIRCKNCKFYESKQCKWDYTMKSQNDYCSYAVERKIENE